MQNRPYSYLFYLQYLGLRYHGWQKQLGVKTIQGTLEKAFRFVLGHEDFTILGASRTDAEVSCNGGAFELFLKHEISPDLIETINSFLPSDIRLLGFEPVPLTFNVIQDVIWKEYRFHFAIGEKFHPFAAGNMTFFEGIPDLDLMKKGAKLFVGKHDFRRFCSIDKVTDDYIREVLEADICSHSQAGKGLTPEKAFTFSVKGKGFLRYQVRMMMAALMDLGLGKITLEDFKNALDSDQTSPISIAAPANGLVLERVEFKK
ncbi:tRNA pseudouridine(38-40) synthase TruA [Aquiflexum sp. LQ15W]|uniref:tRNA pseudouridine(38-40) synthase TruA n=1 Tax=Cognataquiflexum nitidum TaxID=2922272 RepID=UPI001F13C321|nr:tRNA pseudouridine(38-40) synthase TruA [Cognataquiflexum nitidum]MCH6198016.1 tRNA pseudouridine(38-40) synthase TruA [Cognataquiflexum nitidum]